MQMRSLLRLFHERVAHPEENCRDFALYNNQINARDLIGQSAMGYCAGKPMEKSRLLNYYIKVIDHKFIWLLG